LDLVIRPIVTILLAVAVAAAAVLCPCPEMARANDVVADEAVESAEHACCSATPQAAPDKPEPSDRHPCPHCAGAASLVSVKDVHEKVSLAPTAFVTMVELAFVSPAPIAVVLIRSTDDALIHASPPDRLAVVCSFRN
jgi:hypothetical protein